VLLESELSLETSSTLSLPSDDARRDAVFTSVERLRRVLGRLVDCDVSNGWLFINNDRAACEIVPLRHLRPLPPVEG
jgi:hypothetical protein